MGYLCIMWLCSADIKATLLYIMKDNQEKQIKKVRWALKVKRETKMRKVISGIIADEKQLPKLSAHLILLWPVMPPPLPSNQSLLLSREHPETEQWGGLKEDSDGKERHFLKGSSQWDQKDVHNHSVNKLGDGREESTFPFVFLWKFLTRPMIYDGTDGGKFQEYTAVSTKVAFDLSSLNGWGSPYLCCRKPWVPFECLTVWLIDWVSSEGKVELLRPDLAEKERNLRQDFCIFHQLSWSQNPWSLKTHLI